MARERNILAQYSALHKALTQNLAGKGASEEDAGKRATAILKENMPELSDAAVETVRTLRTMESNVQASHAKAEELGYENYYVNQYTGEPIPISNPDDEIFSGREKATFNMKLAGAMDTHNVRDPNDLTLGQIRQAFAGTPLEDKINSLYPAEQSGKKIGEYAAEEEAKVEKKSLVGRGGPGSGHFEHKGRPGERGGSLPSGGGASPLKRNVKMKTRPDGYSVKFTDDAGNFVSSGWYRTLEAAQKDMDEWMATGGIVPKPGDFHSAPSKGVKRYRVGTLNGEKVEIVYRPRTSVADTSESQDYLIHGDRIYPLDTNRMMFKRLRDLLPEGYMTPRVTVKDWEPFIDEANRRGHNLPIDFHSAKMPAYNIEREEDNYWGAPTGFRIGDKRYGLDELGKMFGDQPGIPETDRELAIRQVAKKPTKKAIGDVLQWSTSRYNDYSKAQAVDIARKTLAEGKERRILSAGSYTPATSMTGSDYLVNGPEGYIAVGSGGTQELGEEGIEGFVEQKRYYFRQPKPSVAKSLVARYSRRLVGK
jgi:hypothetical protein